MPDGIKIFDDALLHFGRGLIGKSDGQYAGCRDVLKQQGNVAGSQRVGFSRTGGRFVYGDGFHAMNSIN